MEPYRISGEGESEDPLIRALREAYPVWRLKKIMEISEVPAPVARFLIRYFEGMGWQSPDTLHYICCLHFIGFGENGTRAIVAYAFNIPQRYPYPSTVPPLGSQPRARP